MKIVVGVDLAQYPHVKLKRDIALRLIEVIVEKHGTTRDLEEARRIILNFDEYYNIARKKSDGYLVVMKDPADSLRKKSVVHKVRLLVENGEKVVEIVFDRNMSRELLISSLRETSFSEIEFTAI